MTAGLANPSYVDGYAPRDGLSQFAFPGLAHAWAPSLGHSGRKVIDAIGRGGQFDAACNEAARPTWSISSLAQPDANLVLEWDGDDADSYLDVGDITDFHFLLAEKWTIVASGAITATGDERTIVAKWTSDGNTRQFILRYNPGSSPHYMQVYTGGTETIAGNNILAVNTWYTWAVTNDGTGGAGGVNLQTYNKTGALLESETGQHDPDRSDLALPIELWGRSDDDPMRGFGGPIYFFHGVLPDTSIRHIARDNIAPLRLAENALIFPPSAPPVGGGRKNPMNMPLTFPIGGPL